ncbi:MAG: hypothetical protein ACJ8FT_05220 [Sphingomonas sp.]
MFAAFAAVLIEGAVAATPSAKTFGALAGCWQVSGAVRGKDAASVARGTWHLGRRYFMLQLKSAKSSQGYEAALLYGAGEKPGGINAYWMDSFGGAYSTSGAGEITRDGFNVVYRYPDASYFNRFARAGRGWHWTIMEQATGKPEQLFAEYRLRPTSCGGLKFNF